jgi:aminopeptidase
MEDKYIELLLKRCLVFKENKALFINYEKAANQEFVENIVLKAHQMGIKDIYLNDEASFIKHDLLTKINLEDITNYSIFNNFKWDMYAKKGAAFLLIESEIPHLMDDISPDKIAKVHQLSQSTKPVYKEKQLTDEISWCICSYPNKIWANSLFPNDPKAYQKLYNLIMQVCMCDQDDPIKEWNNYINIEQTRINKLNSLKIKTLHYQNKLGTDLTIGLIPETHFEGAENKQGMLLNMPSYEIFTSPHKLLTNGIVYASKPLIYNGVMIDKFYLEFKDGQVINYGAKTGLETLKKIIEETAATHYLGECALVNYDSPISNTKQIFNTTLIDENAACHLALGAGFPTTVNEYQKYSKEELSQMGINEAPNHVDFMIGTADLKITAETNNGEIIIFKDGNFTI